MLGSRLQHSFQHNFEHRQRKRTGSIWIQADQSSTWIAIGDYPLMAESSLGIMSDGQYGLDTVGLGVEATAGLTSNLNG